MQKYEDNLSLLNQSTDIDEGASRGSVNDLKLTILSESHVQDLKVRYILVYAGASDFAHEFQSLFRFI